ncbi:hypothetical protein [uncultured Sphingomonas sp.]|uniref:hypothetical protein n=1 Tax=uncultured Sphingomonas sp. TaxID=158754 RepID=UPI0035C9D3A6
MRRAWLAAIAALCCSAALPAAETSVTIVLKFVKRGSAATAVARFDPASCRACTPVATPLYNAENARETVIALAVPRRRSLELRFTGPRDAVRRVLLENGELPFQQGRDAIVVALPPLTGDAITAAEVASHIVEPGMVLRFEHADPARRAGAYATGRFPEAERRAADVLEFAQRQVIRDLGLGEEAERRNLGRIQVMGFDTNAPHAHVDAPPHIHMHLRWPRNAGTQIGHYYIGADGLLTHNLAGVKGIPGTERRFGRGDTFTTIGPDGTGLYYHRITLEGWLEIGRPAGPACLIRPAGTGGFEDGATVLCGNAGPRRLSVKDDLAGGVFTVATDDVVETFRYDPDTGKLTSPETAPPASPSNFVPDEVANHSDPFRGESPNNR